jgi:hypothetical protein
MAAVVAGLVGVGGVWLLWKHTLGAGPFKGAIVLEVQVRLRRSGLHPRVSSADRGVQVREHAVAVCVPCAPNVRGGALSD